MSQFKPGNGSKLATRRRPFRRADPVRPVTPGAGATATQTLAEPEPFAAEADQIIPSGAQRAAFWSTVLFIFFRFSYLHELLMIKTGIDLHILLVLGAMAVLFALISGGMFKGFSSKIAIAWLGFAVCMIVATGVSTWRGGSFAVLFPYLRTTFLLLILIQAVARTSKDISIFLITIGIAGVTTVLSGLLVSDFRYGRLEMAGAGGSIQDSNDYAALMILVMPAIAYFTLRKGSLGILKPVGVLALGAACFLVLSTGSRGALVSLIVSLLFVLKLASGKIRIALLVGFPLVAIIAIPFLPRESVDRLASLFTSNNQAAEAEASKTQRTNLLIDSLKFTAQHPLLGVGPGTFSIFQAQDAASHGQRGMWHETHNSYTQVSSECGVPALLFYLAGIVLSFNVFRRGRKSPRPEIRGPAQILTLMLVGLATCLFFLSQAYGFGFPVLGGFAIAMERLLKDEGPQLTAAEPATA